MNDCCNPQTPDNNGSKPEPDSPDTIEPFGDWFVRITRPWCEELNANIAANRRLAKRPLLQFKWPACLIYSNWT
jgi:hypothetical protein